MRLLAFTIFAAFSSWGACAQQPSYALPSNPGALINPAEGLQGFAARSTSLNGRWSSGNCATKWYDWSASGLDISFRDQSGKLDIERVVEVRQNGFVTQSVAANHTPAGALWSYQLVSQTKVKIQNLSTGTVFFQDRCLPTATAAVNPGIPGEVGTAFPARVLQSGSPLGPSFSCERARDPVGSTVCGDAYLGRLDREMSQAYYALRHQSSEEQRAQLRQQTLISQQRIIGECRLPATGVPDPATQRRAVPCIAENYRALRDRYVQALTPDARNEATRDASDHIALQAALGATGILYLSEPADGVYGPATRDAISRFQQVHGLPLTGFMSSDTAQELMRPANIATRSLPLPGANLPQQSLPAPSQSVLAQPSYRLPAAQSDTSTPPQRRPSAASQALAEGGGPEDLLMVANASPDAPNAAISLSGELTFLSGKAALCLGPTSSFDFDDRMAAASWFASRKVPALGDISNCREAAFDKLDGFLVTRRIFGQLEAPLFNDVASRLQAGGARAFVVVSEAGRQSARDRRELARVSTEQAVSAARPGYGYATIANASTVACVVAEPASEQAWQVILDNRRGEISLDLGRQLQSKPQMADADTAYIGGRRGVCGLIVASADQLATMFKAFQRDQVKGSYGALWFPLEAIQEAAASLRIGSEISVQGAERSRQSAMQERELRARREEADGVRRENDTRQLRATFGANATAMRDQVGSQAMALFKGQTGGNSAWMASTFPTVSREANRRASEGWVLAESAAEIADYGRSNWSGRNLETAVIRTRFKLKNSDVGRYDDICYVLAYQNDAEFQRTRSSQAFDCANSTSLQQWLVGLSFASSWNAP